MDENILQQILAMRFLQPNAPNPKMGGGFNKIDTGAGWDPIAQAEQLRNQIKPMPSHAPGDINLPSEAKSSPIPMAVSHGPAAPPSPATPPPMPTSATMSSNPAQATKPLGPGSPPPMKVDPASMGAFGASSGDFLGGSLASSGDLAKPPMPPKPSMPDPEMSTPGKPLMGPAMMQGIQGPDNFAPPDPLESAPNNWNQIGDDLQSSQMMEGPVPGQRPLMDISSPPTPNEGGGDLVSLIKKLLHKGR